MLLWMKIQLMCKTLLILSLSLVITTTEVGLSSPAQASSLVGSQDTAIDANSKAKPRFGRSCPNGTGPSFPPPCWRPKTPLPDPREQRNQPQHLSPTKKPRQQSHHQQ